MPGRQRCDLGFPQTAGFWGGICCASAGVAKGKPGLMPVRNRRTPDRPESRAYTGCVCRGRLRRDRHKRGVLERETVATGLDGAVVPRMCGARVTRMRDVAGLRERKTPLSRRCAEFVSQERKTVAARITTRCRNSERGRICGKLRSGEIQGVGWPGPPYPLSCFPFAISAQVAGRRS